MRTQASVSLRQPSSPLRGHLSVWFVERAGCTASSRGSCGIRSRCVLRTIASVLGEPPLQNDLRRDRVGPVASLAALDEACPRFTGGEPFVGEVNRQPRAPVQAVREPPRMGGDPLFGAVHVERQSDHERIGLPRVDEPVDGDPVRLRPPDRDRLERGRGAGHGLPDRGPDSFLAVVERDQRPGFVRHVRSCQAC